MDDDPGSPRPSLILQSSLLAGVCVLLAMALLSREAGGNDPSQAADAATLPLEAALPGIEVGLLIVLAAFFAAAHGAFLSARAKSQANGDAPEGFAARSVAILDSNQAHLLTSILVGQITVLVLYALIAPSVAAGLLARYELPQTPSLMLSIVVCSVLWVLFCELIPRTLASARPDRTARLIALPLRGIVWILNPFTATLLWMTDAVFRAIPLGGFRASPFLTDEELKTAVSASEAGGVLEMQEGQMIQGILRFGDALLREILAPRPDIVALQQDATVREALEVYRERGYSRMPVYTDDLDHIVGVLVAKDLLSCVVKGELDQPVSAFMRQPRFVPETMTALAFVRDAQRMQMHLAIVVDEYGGTAGLVTLEDAMEQVVGEIDDQNEDRKEAIVSLGDGSYRIDGSLSLDELSERLGIPVNEDKHETVGGLLMDLTNKIPEAGDQSEYNGARFTVEAVDGKRATTLKVDVLQASAQESNGT